MKLRSAVCQLGGLIRGDDAAFDERRRDDFFVIGTGKVDDSFVLARTDQPATERRVTKVQCGGIVDRHALSWSEYTIGEVKLSSVTTRTQSSIGQAPLACLAGTGPRLARTPAAIST